MHSKCHQLVRLIQVSLILIASTEANQVIDYWLPYTTEIENDPDNEYEDSDYCVPGGGGLSVGVAAPNEDSVLHLQTS